MDRSRFWLKFAFWGAMLLTLAGIELQSQTAGNVMHSSAGDTRHLLAMGAILVALGWIAAARAWDAGAPWWGALAAIPLTAMFLPFSLIALAALRTAAHRPAQVPVSAWWVLPGLMAGVLTGMMASVVLR